MTGSSPWRRESQTRIKPLRPEGEERREEPRVAVHLHTELLDLEGEAVATGTTQDAGRGGLFVKSDFFEPPGTEVRLTVILDGEEVRLQGQVAWVTEGPPGPGMGIQLETTTESRRLGERLLAQAS